MRLYAYGEQDGFLYYAMELVEGASLEHELRHGRRFTWREVTRLSIGVCRALEHAHDNGVIHRDIKPANLLLAPSGDQVKITDFGIARLFGDHRLTSEGGVLGTAEYMAPEQADGRTVTDRCDQYSLGGVMYALLAGRPPFRANSLMEMLQLQRFGDPRPVRVFAPDTPLELERIIHQLLSKDPQKRFSNALLLSRALEAMDFALSRNLGRVDFVVPGHESPNQQLTQADPLAATLLPEESAERLAAMPSHGPATVLGDPRLEGSPTEAPTELPPGAAVAAWRAGESLKSTDPGSPAAVTRFTKVEPSEEAPATPWQDFLASLISPQSLALLGSLAGVGVLAFWLMRPPTADSLFAKIEPLARQGSHEDWLEADGPITEFLARYPDDPRAAEVTGFREQLELDQLEHRLDRAARGSGATRGVSPLERAYLTAARLRSRIRSKR